MMAGVHIHDALLFAVLIKVAQCGQSDSRVKKSEDITQFYSLEATIRTLLTTMGQSACKVDEVRRRGGKYTEFSRNFLSQPPKQSRYLKGTFNNILYGLGDVPFDGMDIVDTKGSKMDYPYEQLVFTSDGGDCGVFFVGGWGRRGNNYELRSKAGYNGQINTQCFEKFERQRKGAGQRTYHTCKYTS
uniref:Lipocalin n=1 Tax=Rhipicephalus zambeziensis TaxID=60191 RepID=A0A224YCA1_9ACAR